MAEYNYNVSDTLNNIVLSDALDYEIRISTLSSGAMPAFDGIRVDDGTDIVIFFDSVLSGADETILDTVVAAHSGIPIPVYEEFVYSGNSITNMITWESPSKTKKIREKQISYLDCARVSQIVTIQYDLDGLEIERETETFSYDGLRVADITRTLV